MIKPPIFVDARGDLLVFPSLAEAEASLPPLAVQGGHYPAAYDREGRLLRARVRIQQRRHLGVFRRSEERTELVETEHVPTHDAQLRAFLLRFIRPPVPVRWSDGSDPLEGLIRVGRNGARPDEHRRDQPPATEPVVEAWTGNEGAAVGATGAEGA